MGPAEVMFIIATVLWIILTIFVSRKIKAQRLNAPKKTISSMRDVE